MISLSVIFHSTSQTVDITACLDGTGCGQSVCSASNSLSARPAFPDSHTSTLHRVLSAENATVCRVLRDFHLSGNLTECGTISGSVLSGDSDLFRALTHCILFCKLQSNQERTNERN